ncbi:MAG: glyoxylate reductase [Candidatus Njordarchaeia archaeon]
MKPRLFVSRILPGEAISLLKKYFDVEIWDKYGPPPVEIYREKIRDIDALVSLLTDPISKELLDEAKNLKIIAQYAVGYDNIDVDECTKRGIYVTNTPGVLADAVAELTMGLILSITKRIVEADKFVRTGEWEKTKTGWHPTLFLGMDLKNKTLGIIGMGKIGYEVAKRAKGLGLNVIYYSRKRKPDIEKELNAKFFDLDELLSKSDIVSIHVPLTKETHKMIGERELKMMKKTAYLINTSRGKVIDEKALIKALKDGWITGAALDVFEIEPTPKENPLLKLDNVVVTPHIGSAGKETRERMAMMVAENLIKFYNGEVPPNLVNKDVVKISKPGF